MESDPVATTIPILVLVEGKEVGRRWPVGMTPVTIGRDADNDIVLAGRQVSRHHAQVRWTGTQFVVDDLGSKNGTFVNGLPVGPEHPLHPGDRLQVALGYAFSFMQSPVEISMPITKVERPAQPVERLRIDRASRQVWVLEKEVLPPLSPAQFTLLALLHSRVNQVVDREEIVRTVWGEKANAGVTEEAIDALVRRLRGRLADFDADFSYIVTVRGHGFRLQVEEKYPLKKAGRLPKSNV